MIIQAVIFKKEMMIDDMDFYYLQEFNEKIIV